MKKTLNSFIYTRDNLFSQCGLNAPSKLLESKVRT